LFYFFTKYPEFGIACNDFGQTAKAILQFTVILITKTIDFYQIRKLKSYKLTVIH